jgi:hypothetical protein
MNGDIQVRVNEEMSEYKGRKHESDQDQILEFILV